MDQTNFPLKVTVTDTIATATSTITLTIIDLNEAPALNSNTYRTNVNDGAVRWLVKTVSHLYFNSPLLNILNKYNTTCLY